MTQSSDRLAGFYDSFNALEDKEWALIAEELRMKREKFVARLRSFLTGSTVEEKNLHQLWRPSAFGVTRLPEGQVPALVVRGGFRIPDGTQRYNLSYYSRVMSMMTDLAVFGVTHHLVELRDCFPDKPFPQTEAPVWLPRTSEVDPKALIYPSGGKRNSRNVRLESAEILIPESREVRRVDVVSRAGFVPARVIPLESIRKAFLDGNPFENLNLQNG